MTQEQRAQFWLVLRALLDQMPDLGGPDVQPFYDAVNAELDKYTVITEPVAVPEGIAAVVRAMAREQEAARAMGKLRGLPGEREAGRVVDSCGAAVYEAFADLSATELAACGVKGGDRG